MKPTGLSNAGAWASLAFAAALAMALTSCRTLPRDAGDSPPRVQFLLTFDDGPSIRTNYNPTLAILDSLATNDVQPGIKAIFFVQTGHPRGGGTPAGRAIMRRIAQQGQVLGIHSVSPRGHISHTSVSPEDLTVALEGSMDLLCDLSGSDPLFVRPPFGAYNRATQEVYARLGLDMLMSDVRMRDGIIYGYNGSMSRREHIRHVLAHLRRELGRDAGTGPVPIVVQFHDVNPYTARHMVEYLHILVEEATRVGLQLPDQPFLNSRREVIEAAVRRRVPDPPGVERYASRHELRRIAAAEPRDPNDARRAAY